VVLDVVERDEDQDETDETVTFTGEQSSDPNGDRLTYSWTFPDGDASGESVQRSFANTGDKTAELVVSDGELTDDAEVTVTITEPTTAVTVEAISLENQQTLGSQIELLVADSVYAAGESPLTADVPESVNELTVNAAEHEKDMELYADTSATFAVTDSPVTVGQRRMPHCVNGLDNDGDGLVGVWTDEDGNDIPTEGDSGDPGCRSAQDNGEPHTVFTRTIYGASATALVSSSDGKHKQLLLDRSSVSPLPASVHETVGNIYLSTTNQIDAEKDSQGFAFDVKTGTEDNMTDTYQTAIVRDDNSVDGWRTSVLLGVEHKWFEAGLYYQLIAVHQCQADDQLACDGGGNDEVVFATDEMFEVVFSFAYESDEDSESEASALPVKASGDADVTVRSAGYVTGQ
jgi:hypothetical protein